MKAMKIGALVFALAVVPQLLGGTSTEVVDGVTWTYSLSGTDAYVGNTGWMGTAIDAGTTGAVVVPIDKANIRYVFEGGAYLNFIEQDELPRSVINAHIEEFDGSNDVIDYRGTTEPAGYGVCPRHGKTTFFKNLHLPRHFFAPRGKYVVEDMEDSIYKKYGIDPNRVPTDAEVKVFAYCFDMSLAEARSAIMVHKPPSGRQVSNHDDC